MLYTWFVSSPSFLWCDPIQPFCWTSIGDIGCCCNGLTPESLRELFGLQHASGHV
ncbi:hypothetical protein Lalb_Chr02g0151241 [Lupinus albus]|uniref:Uncharacterized protein n=1 Tax=Lupinus albus TaxID=3870 RepID=A0A6A4QZS0_LUPAL|nr:hypothetical protein Lalb_Chr02g0151241 [Lupinus albus]